MVYARKCQECGNIQESKPCNEYKGDSWTETKCRKCKSSSLDFGHDGYVKNSAGKIVRAPSIEQDNLED
jgi:hypothetical protein